jgi:hypothetical protein
MRTIVPCGAAALVLALVSVAHAQQAPAAGSAGISAPAPAPTPTPAPASSTLTDQPPAALEPDHSATSDSPIALPSLPGDTGRFEFGSYGRVHIAGDLRGGTGRDANVVSYGDRIDEDDYAELELRREDRFAPNVTSRVVATLAFFPPFFHFSGNAAQAIAMRNLYAQGTYDDLTLWVGSRMYRGDDIYLLDWWPLDNQNTVGGGAGYRIHQGADETTIAAHVGMQRLDNSYQYETAPAPIPNVLASQLGPTSENVTVLDRPRTIETLKLTHLFGHADPSRKDGFKLIVYGEAHEISAGVYTDDTQSPPAQTPLPADWGWLAGAEVAYWTGRRDTFVQIFVRHAEGIAAYDPLAVPLTFANDRTTRGSSESLVAVGGNVEAGDFGLLYGGYLRAFRDGDPSPTTSQKYDEGILAVRPELFIGQHWGLALEGAFEARRFAVLDPATDQPLVASEWRGGIMPYFSPSGRGSYKRPQLRLIYAVTARNSGVRELYPAQDVFSQRAVEHFLGMGCEWWFNSSSYP